MDKMISDEQGKAIHNKLYGSGGKYVPMEIPKFGETVTVRGSKFILRDDDGTPLFEGEISVGVASGTGHMTVTMSRGMAEEMLAYLTTKSVGTMESNIVNALTVDEEETIRGDVRKFVESNNSARPQDRQAQYEAWQYYLGGLYSTQREFALQECDKIVGELITAGKEPTIADTEEHVRNRARTHAENIFSSAEHEKEQNTEYWVIYLCSLPESHQGIARLAFQEREDVLTGKKADQTNKDGNYCDPSTQTSSLYESS